MSEENKQIVNINWEITSYDKPSANAYFTKGFLNCFLHFIGKKL